jgi:hypothetical protein
MPDQETLVVANGGIRTHPDFGRRKLNIDSMDSSLVYINIEDGELISQHRVPYPHLSIRHLYVNHNGTVAIAMQSQNPDPRQKVVEPLLGIHHHNTDIQCLSADPEIQSLLQGYAADTYINPDETQAILTCPRANRALVWNLRSLRVDQQLQLEGVSGLTDDDLTGQVVFTSASGQLAGLSITTGEITAGNHENVKWDNHCVSVI